VCFTGVPPLVLRLLLCGTAFVRGGNDRIAKRHPGQVRRRPQLASLLGVPLSGDHRGGGIEGGELRAHRGDVVLFPVIAPTARHAAHREGDVDTATLAGCHQRYQTPPPRPAVTG
jgi:hypothetical protein